MERFPTGKLPNEVLAELLSRFAGSAPEVLAPPGVGYDATAIALGDQCLVVATDPITFAVSEIGWYSVMVNANDVACFGADPKWFLATLLLPEETADRRLVDELFGQIMEACRQIGAVLCGGHTEITHGLDRPIVVGCMVGEVSPERLVRPEGARPGDALLLTKGIAVEGTAIIAREKGGELAGIDQSVLERCQGFLYDPGISVVRDAAVATAAGGVHAMHDPTEGGLATGLWELAEAAGVGLEVDKAAIPILSETRILCARLGLDPLGLISSGALLLAVASQDTDAILKALEEAGIAAARIGHVAQRAHGIMLRDGNDERPLRPFARDEITRLFE